MLADAIEEDQPYEIDGVGHNSNTDRPDEINSLILDLVKRKNKLVKIVEYF